MCVGGGERGKGVDGCEDHLGGDIIEPNLEVQEYLPLSKLCGTEGAEVIKGNSDNKWIIHKLQSR